MFKNLSTLMFLLTLISGSLISISSNSWLGAWMGLEINLLSFIPLMSDSKNLFSNESMLKYFLVQALASSILLFIVILLSMINSLNIFLKLNLFFSLILNSSLMLKMGAAPFHFWFPGVMEGLSWKNNFILMTWQKIAPLILLTYHFNLNFLISIIFISIFIGSIGGLNQTSLRKLMAYSSINHIGWMLSTFMISNYFLMIYFLLYSFLSFSIIFMFHYFNVFFINQCFNLMNNSPILKFSFFCNFLSLGGLPPFLGFLPKWLVIQNLALNYSFMIFIMVILTLITLFFYIRITYAAFMLNYSNIKWFSFSKKYNLMLYFCNFLSLGGLPMIIFIHGIF
uniref:NADH-ubiquinone oxidoreductase chain 2 n=1 Tax=Thaumatosmylus hainanus TaxID=2713041 RepID=A0A6G6C5S3_9NEOP|nr:NADH dehydrogenase subunit 2 [Thaumatosmylus hainanus]QID76376.1 NADH dehydrogenase subunit 2 [Thaumatosmylus hainanus]